MVQPNEIRSLLTAGKVGLQEKSAPQRVAALGAAYGDWQEPFSRKQKRDRLVPFFVNAPKRTQVELTGKSKEE